MYHDIVNLVVSDQCPFLFVNDRENGQKMGPFSIGLDSTMCSNLWFGFLATGPS